MQHEKKQIELVALYKLTEQMRKMLESNETIEDVHNMASAIRKALTKIQPPGLAEYGSGNERSKD